MTADQRGPGRRSQIYISSGSLCGAVQMHHQEMWCKFPQGRHKVIMVTSELLLSSPEKLFSCMYADATWVLHRQTELACCPDMTASVCFKLPALNWSLQLFSVAADSNSCFVVLNVPSKLAGGWEPAHWLWLARGGPDYFTDHHPNQQGRAGHPFQSGHVWGSQCRKWPGPDVFTTISGRSPGQSFSLNVYWWNNVSSITNRTNLICVLLTDRRRAAMV